MISSDALPGWIAAGVLTVVNVGAVGYFAGRVTARLQTLTSAVSRLEGLHMTNPGQSRSPSIGPATRISGASEDPDT